MFAKIPLLLNDLYHCWWVGKGRQDKILIDHVAMYCGLILLKLTYSDTAQIFGIFKKLFDIVEP